MRPGLLARVTVASAVTVATLGIGVATGHAAAQPSWFWEWSDGSRERQREVSEARFDTWSRVPSIRVISSPPHGGVRVRLQTLDEGVWRTEDVATTDRQGRASLRINPYCADGAWCAGTARYRLSAGAATAALTVDFRPSPSPP